MSELLYQNHRSELVDRRDLVASPYFTYKLDAVMTTGTKRPYSWESVNTRARKYLPFTSIIITNRSSTEPIEVYINQDSNNSIYVAPSQVVSADISSVPSIWGFTISNIGTGSLSANEVIIACKRDGLTQDAVYARSVAQIGTKKGVMY